MSLWKIFQSGFRLINGDDLNSALGDPSWAYESGIAAKASGTVNNSTLLTQPISQIDTVASAADGVLLPAAVSGNWFLIINNGVNSAQVFAAGGSTINGTAGSTGIAHANAKTGLYFCAKNGAWFRLLSA